MFLASAIICLVVGLKIILTGIEDNSKSFTLIGVLILLYSFYSFYSIASCSNVHVKMITKSIYTTK